MPHHHRRHRLAEPTAEPGAPVEGDARPKARLLLLLLCVAQLMVILDISAVNVALPDLAADVGLGRGDLAWTITSYSVAFGGLLLLGGRAADLLGRRRVFLGGLALFTIASVASALAASAATLFASRAAQGAGAAMLSPAALSILVTTFREGRERTTALGAWGAVGGAGAAVGVLLGGALTELVDWRAIFLINLPIGVALAAGALHVLPADDARPRWHGLDLRGAVLATAGFAALVLAASQAGTAGWTSAQTLGLGAAGLAALAAFAAVELRTPRPLLEVRRLADRAVGGGALLMLAASAVMFGAFLLSPCTCRRCCTPERSRPGWRSCRWRRRSAPAPTPARSSSAAAACACRWRPGSRSRRVGCCCSRAWTPGATTSRTSCPGCWSRAWGSAWSWSRWPSPSSAAPPTRKAACCRA